MTSVHSGERDGPDWTPDGLDVSRPSVARVYDYYLGGSHNFPADRDAAEQTLEAFPDVRLWAHANRAFLRRAVRYLAERGIDQFLDIGSGIPTVGNVHEIAQSADRDARVVYVDIDPIAVSHSRALLAGNPNTAVVQADIRDADRILHDQETRALLDLDRPVGLLMLAVVQFLPDGADPAGLVRRYRDALVPGSYLAISHLTDDRIPGNERFDAWKSAYDGQVARTVPRSKAAIESLFDGFSLVEPGVVMTPDWRPDGEEQAVPMPVYSAMGRRR